MQCTYSVTLISVRPTIVAVKKATIITYSDDVYVALVTQQATLRAVLCCHVWPVCLYLSFPHYLINGTIFEKKCY
jgi:hypothetical protein